MRFNSTLIIFALVLSLFQFCDLDVSCADTASTHGMLVFGGEQVGGGFSPTYFAHLPMFHAPHDYQVLLEVELQSTAYQASVKSQVSPSIYTFEPERFVLPDTMKAGACFKGHLFRGHFERGGIDIAANERACIKSVLFFKKLNADAQPSSNWTGFVLGSGSHSWLIHRIGSRPSFDQVIAISQATALSFGTQLKSVAIDCPDLPLLHPVQSSKAMERQLKLQTSSGFETVDVVREYYLETGDLE